MPGLTLHSCQCFIQIVLEVIKATIGCINTLLHVVLASVIDQCQKMKASKCPDFPFCCCIYLKIDHLKIASLCEINYVAYFKLSIGPHKYAFSCTKGNKHPTILPVFQTNQLIAVSGNTVISHAIKHCEMSRTGA